MHNWDYDLTTLQPGPALRRLREDADTKFKREIDPLVLGSQLERGRHFPVIPRLLRTVEPHDVQNFFHDLARSLRSDVVEE
jgi:hypothetical protein